MGAALCYELSQTQLLVLGQLSAAEENMLEEIPVELPPTLSLRLFLPTWPVLTSHSQQPF